MASSATHTRVATSVPSLGRVTRWIKQHFIWAPLVFAVAWTGLPLAWALSASFKTKLEIYESPPTLVPNDLSLQAYREVLANDAFWLAGRNSLLLAVISTVLAVGLSSLAAYGFARYAFKWRHLLLLFIIVPRLVPRVSLIVPVYRLMETVGLLDTPLALIIVYTGTALPLSTWIMIGFIKGIPTDLEEAARVDGASTWQAFRKVTIPLALPGIMTISVLAFREAWNEFPFVLALTSSAEARTLPYQLFNHLDATGLQDWSVVQAFTLLTIIPIIVLYLAFERHIVSGLIQGAVK